MSGNPRRPLYRSTKDRMVAGVCGGIAEAWNLDPAIVRLVTVLIAASTGGTGLLIYVILAIVMPTDAQLRASGRLSGTSDLASLEADAAPDALLPAEAPVEASVQEAAFTPEEIKRWDLPGEASAAAQGPATGSKDA